MSRRLVAFGCSFTYGHGLPDCHLPGGRPGPHPSKHAWPAIVAKDLGRECVNLSRPGASSKQVAYHILNTEFHKDDIVAIWWPHVTRTCYFHEDGLHQLGPWDPLDPYTDPKLVKHWHYKMAKLGDTDGHIERRMWITAVNSYLELRTKLVTNYVHERDDAIENLISCVPHPVAFTDDILSIDIALDNAHPGIKSQKGIAKNVLQDIKRKLLMKGT